MSEIFHFVVDFISNLCQLFNLSVGGVCLCDHGETLRWGPITGWGGVLRGHISSRGSDRQFGGLCSGRH